MKFWRRFVCILTFKPSLVLDSYVYLRKLLDLIQIPWKNSYWKLIYVDELASVGLPFRHEEHVEAILKGLPWNFSPVVFVIESK